MKTLNYVKILVLAVVTLGLSSCGGDEYYTDEFLRNSDEKLCRTEWIDEYVTSDDRLCTHTFVFNMDHRGKETLRYRSRLPNGNWDTRYSESSTIFNWSWLDNSMEGLQLDYVDYVRFFDNVWVRDHYLSGKLDGVHVTFMDPATFNQ